ncbi:TetR/AcrR family transcriptional regulator [Myxococcota bacterium]|nr:TetR/AcrR family transcriptional regulator [Myxococcota bacterium]
MARPRKHTDQELLDAAREVFLAHGPAASTTLVADAVGLSQAALFKRFGTKEQLMVRALMPPPRIGWVEALEAGPGPGPLPDQLVEIAVEATRFFDRMMPCLMTLKAAGLNLAQMVRSLPTPPPILARRAATAWFLRAMDQGRMRRADADALAYTFIGSVQSRSAMSHIFGEPALTESQRLAHARGVVDGLWNGLRPPPSETT